MVKTEKDKVKPKAPQTSGETVLPLAVPEPPPVQMASLEQMEGPKIGERPSRLGLVDMPDMAPSQGMQGPRFITPQNPQSSQTPQNLPSPGMAPDETSGYSRLQAQLEQMDNPKPKTAMDRLFSIAGGINFMDPAQFENLEQRKIGQDFDIAQTKRKNLVEKMQGIKSNERQIGQDARQSAMDQRVFANDAAAEEERKYAQSRRPIQERMDQAALTKAEAPTQQPKLLDEFVNAQGKKVYLFQNPDGTTKYEESPQMVQATPKAVDKPDYEWVNRGGKPLQIRKGTAQPGDTPYDAVGARQQGGTPGTSPYATERAQRTIQSVDAIMGKVNGRTTGYGSLLSGLPESDARDFKAELDTLKANIAFNELTAMREASKTGGALGQVSERELQLLESALGALDAGQSQEALKANLTKIKTSVQRWQDAQKTQDSGGGGKFSVTAPDGSVHPFDTQAQADAFKKLAGIQ